LLQTNDACVAIAERGNLNCQDAKNAKKSNPTAMADEFESPPPTKNNLGGLGVLAVSGSFTAP